MTDNIYNPFSLNGKIILVTGASSGIGRATAIECSKMGAKVILTARKGKLLNETLSMMRGKNHLAITADLSQEPEIQQLAESIPRVNGIVNAAGKTCDKPLKYYSSSAVEDTFRVNTFSSIYLVREILKKGKLWPGASLIFISSIASCIHPTIGNGIYSATKASLEAFSRQCAIELHNQKIRANTINPGIIETPMINSYMENPFFDKELLNFMGKPEDVARLAVYLLSDASSFVTGSSFVMDGGLSLIK